MNHIPDRIQRKHEIGMAFRKEPFLPHEADSEIYATVLERIGVKTTQDVSILISILQDAIMMARREERPTTPLDTFRDWLMWKLVDTDQ